MITNLATPDHLRCENDSALNNLKRSNFIFGSNGTGKSSVCRAIQEAATHAELEYCQFDDDFVAQNFRGDRELLEAVYTLGDEQNETFSQIFQLKNKKDKLQEDILNISRQLEDKKEKINRVEDSTFKDILKIRKTIFPKKSLRYLSTSLQIQTLKREFSKRAVPST